MQNEELIRKAISLLNPRALSDKADAGQVASVLVTDKGRTYQGVCIDAACGVGFCAETNAIGNMVTGGESRIKKICAVNKHEKIVTPCGRCRELMIQVDSGNGGTEIVLDEKKTITLKELLPEHWLVD